MKRVQEPVLRMMIFLPSLCRMGRSCMPGSSVRPEMKMKRSNFSMNEKEELYEEFQSLLAKGSMLPAELVSLAIEVFTIGE